MMERNGTCGKTAGLLSTPTSVFSCCAALPPLPSSPPLRGSQLLTAYPSTSCGHLRPLRTLASSPTPHLLCCRPCTSQQSTQHHSEGDGADL